MALAALAVSTAAARPNGTVRVNMGYFVDVMPHLAACSRGWLDTDGYEVGCMPQSSGTFAVVGKSASPR